MTFDEWWTSSAGFSDIHADKRWDFEQVWYAAIASASAHGIEDLIAGATTMQVFEQTGGNGWWDGWYRIKIGLAKHRARLEPLRAT